MELLTFKLDNLYYGIDLVWTVELIPLPYITRLASLPSFICGIIDLRGQTVPIIDLKERIGAGRSKFELENDVIIVNFKDKRVGLLVDDVISVESIDDSNFIPPPSMLEGIDISFMKAAVKTSTGLLISLSLENILRVEDVSSTE